MLSSRYRRDRLSKRHRPCRVDTSTGDQTGHQIATAALLGRKARAFARPQNRIKARRPIVAVHQDRLDQAHHQVPKTVVSRDAMAMMGDLGGAGIARPKLAIDNGREIAQFTNLRQEKTEHQGKTSMRIDQPSPTQRCSSRESLTGPREPAEGAIGHWIGNTCHPSHGEMPMVFATAHNRVDRHGPRRWSRYKTSSYLGSSWNAEIGGKGPTTPSGLSGPSDLCHFGRGRRQTWSRRSARSPKKLIGLVVFGQDRRSCEPRPKSAISKRGPMRLPVPPRRRVRSSRRVAPPRW